MSSNTVRIPADRLWIDGKHTIPISRAQIAWVTSAELQSDCDTRTELLVTAYEDAWPWPPASRDRRLLATAVLRVAKRSYSRLATQTRREVRAEARRNAAQARREALGAARQALAAINVIYRGGLASLRQERDAAVKRVWDVYRQRDGGERGGE